MSKPSKEKQEDLLGRHRYEYYLTGYEKILVDQLVYELYCEEVIETKCLNPKQN